MGEPDTGLFVHAGNRLEDLADRLIAAWRAAPRPPLSARPLIVESASMGRWVQQRLCQRQGISMLVETPLPAQWLWHTARRLLELADEEDPLSRQALQWRIHRLLLHHHLPDGEEAHALRRYLEDGDALKRWQLAGRIADVFDRYQYHRPELVRAWSRGDFSRGDWQGPLWRQLTENIRWHRLTLLEHFLQRLEEGHRAGLPPRIDLFSMQALPRLLLEAYVALAGHCQVHFWLLSPTDQYWADLASPRQLARQRLQAPESAELWQQGHPLLTRWGRQGQMFQDMLLDATSAFSIDDEAFVPPSEETLLHRLQGEILQATSPDDSPVTVKEDARLPSIQLHDCHGALRECQVLRDTLLHCLQADPSLQPEDILVMVPEIGSYAPLVEAVFGSSGEAVPALPYNIADVTLADEHPLIRAFLSLLDLPESRFTRAEIVSLLHLPEIQRRLGLQPGDVAELVELLDQLRVYWGLDAADKRSRLDLPAIPDNTWRQGFERILSGYALGDDALYGELAPMGRVSSQTGDRAARLFDLLERLRAAAHLLRRPADPATWAARLGALTEDLFAEVDDDSRLTRIRDALSDLERAGGLHPEALEPAAIRHWLEQRLGSDSELGRPYSGGVTFCAMKPLRGVPFRVICLLGMQDQAFPRRRSSADFDLMGKEWRHGDPHPGQEDRYLFLETLLAARDRLLLFWTGHDPRSNEPLQASAVVEELREYLDQRFRLADGGAPGTIVYARHPLQPFSAGNFQGDLPGFHRWWHQAAQRILQRRQPMRNSQWPRLSLPPPERSERRIEPAELGRFLRDPARQFVFRRLHLLPPEDEPLAEEEPMESDGLSDWLLRTHWLRSWLQGEEETALARRMRAEGRLLHGRAGAQQLAEARPQILDRDSLPFQLPLTHAPCDCDLVLEAGDGTSWRLQGRLACCHRDAKGRSLLLATSGSAFRHADLLPLWVEHLCRQALEENPAESWYLEPEGLWRLRALPAHQALEWLNRLLTLYLEGQCTPLPLLRDASSAWIAEYACERRQSAQNTPEARRQRALKKAREAWHGNRSRAGEKEKPHCRLLLANNEWEPDQAFADLALAVLGPIAEHLEEA